MNNETDGDYYQHPYTTKGVNVKELFRLPLLYPNVEELGRAFRELIATAQEIEYIKRIK